MRPGTVCPGTGISGISALAPLLLLVSLLSFQPASAQSVEFKGELSSSVMANDADSFSVHCSARYLPEIFCSIPWARSNSIDLNCSLEASSRLAADSFDEYESRSDLEFYRMWLRVQSARTELRIGLQKINFGSATLIRPLMWFDNIDRRDPLRISEGVWGVLARYYFAGNANIWAWGLLGNEDPKGWERIPTDGNEPEYGGRLQVPLPRGECGFSYHHRSIDMGELRLPLVSPVDSDSGEDRFGFDARWDVSVGLWAEASLVHRQSGMVPVRYQHLLTVGADYTFDIGQGLTVLVEQFRSLSSDEMFGTGQSYDLTGMSLTWPRDVLDTVSAIFYYDHTADDFYGFLDWMRRYDHWSIHLIGFANPDGAGLSFADVQGGSLAGNGAQILVVFNH